MLVMIPDLVHRLAHRLERQSIAESRYIAESCAFLEACGYPGIVQLQEALGDEIRQLSLVKDVIGLDLKNVSCVFLARPLGEFVSRNGRVFLRNVRHGLYLLPDSVTLNYGIGCPVDPSFALGGARAKNPYAEKLDAAMGDGINIDDNVWQSLAA